MKFDATVDIQDQVAIITLSGQLDASAAPLFRQKIEEVAPHGVTRLVLMMQDLEYMASAGLRTLVFAKQKMGSDVEIYLIGTQETVAETIELTGFQHSVIMQDRYEAA